MAERKSLAAKVTYRETGEADRAQVRALQEAVYDGSIAALCDAMIFGSEETLSLVAELDGQVIGQILLAPVSGPERALALAPHAVLPAWRDMQIGTELVRHALKLARHRGWRSVFVFGQPDYYRRFGFRSRTADCADVTWQGPRFLALELEEGALAAWSGPLDYPESYLAVALSVRR
ncbi:MAG: N-acetyltransferase [Hoeflea sp.]|uniref:GNAT family N-acetyltransferase n=1 Tax=Hoeflea sp. TaxID=1940281 RepID=UPI002731F7FF|nr:N-acetyltransferase [Hoeflea sp.]MDP2120230.1 N-acetyltransferase [Hoeflea sp.]MDZ7602965.1 N-acetyltransferase [Hoeflea sp.]